MKGRALKTNGPPFKEDSPRKPVNLHLQVEPKGILMKAAELMVEALKFEGVQRIYGVPGEENLDFMEALRKSGIRFIVTRHEQAAAFMAATEGRLNGKAGVCLSTLGPGATNLVTGAAYAQLGAMPMLMITGQKPIKTSKQGRFQIIDTVDMMQPLTKYTRQIVFGDAIPSRVREALRIAEEERPGAVHLELPEDVAKEDVSVPMFEKGFSRRPVTESKAVDKAVELISKARRPLLLIGAAANRKQTCRKLREFVDKYEIPFFDTQMGKGVIDNRHDLYLGCAALSDHDYLHCAIAKSDLIINVGHDVVEKPPFLMSPDGPKVIHINFRSASVDPVYFPHAELIGDIANSIWQIMQHLEKQPRWDFSYYRKTHSALLKSIQKYENMEKFPVTPQRLVHDVRKVMPDDGIVALDNGIYKIWFARNYFACLPNTLLLDNALASMGAGLPSAIAAAMLFPKRRVLAVCGDGGFMMNVQELETAVRLKVNLCILVLRDDAFGMVRWKQADMGFKNFGMDFGNPDFVKLAECFGGKGHRVSKTKDLEKMILKAQRAGGVHVIDVPVDYSQNRKFLSLELNKKTCAF